jgi:hypothetical protein
MLFSLPWRSKVGATVSQYPLPGPGPDPLDSELRKTCAPSSRKQKSGLVIIVQETASEPPERIKEGCLEEDTFFFFYSYVHTMFGPFLPPYPQNPPLPTLPPPSPLLPTRYQEGTILPLFLILL